MNGIRRRRLLCALIAVAAGLSGPNQAAVRGVEPDARVDAVLGAINHEREIRGLPSLSIEPAASDSASSHCEDLRIRNVLSHRGEDGSRVNERYRRAGGTGLRSGEILGAGGGIDGIVAAWMDSPPHRESLLDPRWSRAGVGVGDLGGGRILAAVVFTSSRWRFISLSAEDDHVNLSGEAVVLPEGPFPEPFLSIGEEVYRPVAPPGGGAGADDSDADSLPGGNAGLTVLFRFPRPDAWAEDGIATAFFGLDPRESPSDLLLLRRPLPGDS